MIQKERPPSCGGQLHRSNLGRPGDIVPCPICAKKVKLSRPFNGAITGWVQVPRHNRAPKLVGSAPAEAASTSTEPSKEAP